MSNNRFFEHDTYKIKQGNKIDYYFLSILGLITFVIAGFVSLDTGSKGLALFFLGGLLGIVFIFFQYGFASGWRKFIINGDTRPIGYHFLLIGFCSFAFLPISYLGLGSSGSFAPISISLLIGSFIFGIGMQLANGCGSGVLFTFGGGSGRMIFALPAFIIGSVIGSIIVPSALEWGSFGQVIIAGDLGPVGRWVTNLILIFGVSYGLYYLARRKGESLPPHLFKASIAIAILCWAVFFVSGHPWGVTFGFTLWGAKLAQASGIPIGDIAFWQWVGPEQALRHSVLANASSVLNIGMIIGAGLVASWSGGLRRQNFPPTKQIIAAIIGGLIMGVGARLSFGCNIGAFLAGTGSGSLHGWIWFVMAMSGSWVGVRLRPHFGF